MRKVTKTCQVKLDIPEDRKEDVLETFRQYNYALNYSVDKAWEPDKKIYSKAKLHDKVYYPIRDKTDLQANLVCSASNKVCDTIKSVIQRWKQDKKASKPKFKSFSAIQFDKRTLTIKPRKCTFACVGGRVKADYIVGDYQREMLDDPNYEFKTGTLTIKNGEFFLNITIVKPALVKKPDTVMGVDLGVNNIAVTSTGKFFSAGPLAERQRQLRETRKDVQSKGTRSARRLLKRKAGKENRFTDWYLHNVSRRIVDEALENDVEVIAFEDLTDIREDAKNWRKDQRKRVNLWAFSKLQSYVQYKALEAGIDTVFVESKDTSRKCSKCGHTQKSNRKGSDFKCKECGYSLDADYNASKNIGIRALSGKSPDWAGPPCKLALKTGSRAYV